MFTLTTIEKHYPIAQHQMHLLEQDFDVAREHPQTKEKHTLHLTKQGVPFQKMTKKSVLTDIVLTADVERHQLLEREGATFKREHYAQMMEFPVGYDRACESMTNVVHMYGNGWTVPGIC